MKDDYAGKESSEIPDESQDWFILVLKSLGVYCF